MTTSKKTRVRNRSLAEAKLLEAALELFSKLGIDGATTKLISQKSGINESLIIRYFGSKEGLLFAVMRQFMDQKEVKPLSYAPQKTVALELKNYMKETVDELYDKTDFHRIIISKGLTDQEFARKAREISPLVADPRLATRLKDFQKNGLIASKLDVEELAMQVGFQAFGVTFVSVMLFEMKKSFALTMLLNFADSFAKGIQ